MLVMASRPTTSVYQTALAALKAGISVIPIRADGTKRPAVRWKPYQQRRATAREARQWFEHTTFGIAFVTGWVSQLEVLDFDTCEIYAIWAHRLREIGFASLLMRLERGYREASPTGVHLLYHCSVIEGNAKLARHPVAGPAKVSSLIETRGEGGYCIVAPSSGQVHKSGQPYRMQCGGVLTIASITPEERAHLFAAATDLDAVSSAHLSVPSSTTKQAPATQGGRPGDLFNQQARWEEILTTAGWQLVYTIDEEGYWRRPGKEGPGISATTNYQHSALLYVFSTSTCFEPERGYSKFSAYTLLFHGGDFAAAAKALVEAGSCLGRYPDPAHLG